MNSQESKEYKDGLDAVIRENVEAITKIEDRAHQQRSRTDVISDAIAGFCGSVAFVYVHCLWFLGWLLWNSVSPKSAHFDPPPFGILTLIVSLEAIFLSTFILISQNRQQRMADQRNHLDLQINLLAEQENSHMLKMLHQIMQHLGIDVDVAKDQALEKETDPAKVAQQIQENLIPEHLTDRKST